MKLVTVKVIFEVLLVPNKWVFRIQVNYVKPEAELLLNCLSASLPIIVTASSDGILRKLPKATGCVGCENCLM